jgi:hypothetical protein
MKCFLDRAFFRIPGGLQYKVRTSVVILRRAGAMSAYEQLEQLPDGLGMPSSVPVDAVFGAQPARSPRQEGLQRLHKLGKNMRGY